MSANERQVGGGHYQAAFQHWDLVARLGLGYFEGQVTKYVTRHRKKNGRQDAEKALHFLEKLIELSNAGEVKPPAKRPGDLYRLLGQYSSDNGLTMQEDTIIKSVSTWLLPMDLRVARRALVKMVEGTYNPSHRVDVTALDSPKRRSYDTDTGKVVEDGSEPGAGYVDQDR